MNTRITAGLIALLSAPCTLSATLWDESVGGDIDGFPVFLLAVGTNEIIGTSLVETTAQFYSPPLSQWFISRIVDSDNFRLEVPINHLITEVKIQLDQIHDFNDTMGIVQIWRFHLIDSVAPAPLAATYLGDPIRFDTTDPETVSNVGTPQVIDISNPSRVGIPGKYMFNVAYEILNSAQYMKESVDWTITITVAEDLNDIDQDGLSEFSDNCPSVPNPGQENSDARGDGGDACDSDDDNDGIEDLQDNCPLISNADQANGDGDDLGDACDPTIGPDADHDGVIDSEDNCLITANPDQADIDGNGVGDLCEAIGC